MSTSWLSSEERKRQMRENIILHRRKVLCFLENVYDTNLKPKVKSDKSELLELDLFIKNKTRDPVLLNDVFRLKKQSFNDSESSDVSVGSVEGWKSACQKSELAGDGRPSRLLINKNSQDSNNKTLYYDKSKADYVYNDSTAGNSKKKRLKNRTQEEINKMRFKIPLLRNEHNAKERAVRSLIAKSFVELSKCCSYLEQTRRTPSKFSILVAAKKECDSLKVFEKKLLMEKDYWLTANNQLRKRLVDSAAGTNHVVKIDTTDTRLL